MWWIDAFGNCQTNISPEDLHGLGAHPGDELSLKIAGIDYDVPWTGAYGDVEPGEVLLHVDSYGLVAIAVRNGSAADRLNLTSGHQVVLET